MRKIKEVLRRFELGLGQRRIARSCSISLAIGWQAHTVRGFDSGTLLKKLRRKVESFRSDDKERRPVAPVMAAA